MYIKQYMKKSFTSLCTIALLCCLASCGGGSDPNAFTIEGNLSGLADGDTLLAIPVENSAFDAEAIAAAAVGGGHFLLSGTTTEPRLVYLKVKGCYGFVRVMIESGQHAVINGTATKEQNGQGADVYTFNATVEDSPLTDEFNAKYAKREEVNKMHDDMEAQFTDLTSKLQAAWANPDRTAYYALRQTDEYKAYEKATSEFFHTCDSVLTGIMSSNGDSFWGPIMMYALTAYISPDMKPIYENFSDAAKNTLCGKALCEELYPAGQIGSLAKDFTTTAADGTQTTLKALCEGKKLLLLDFWASWCGPCRKEIPNVKAIYDKHHANGFEVVSISIDQDLDAWKKAVEEEALVWPNFCDRKVSDLYKVKAVPTLYLLDGNMRVVGLDLRGQELADKVDELMAK